MKLIASFINHSHFILCVIEGYKLFDIFPSTLNSIGSINHVRSISIHKTTKLIRYSLNMLK